MHKVNKLESNGQELPCPSDNARGIGKAHLWKGNQPEIGIGLDI